MNWTELHEVWREHGFSGVVTLWFKARFIQHWGYQKNGRQRHEMEHIFDNFTESTSTICKQYQNSSGENSYV